MQSYRGGRGRGVRGPNNKREVPPPYGSDIYRKPPPNGALGSSKYGFEFVQKQ